MSEVFEYRGVDNLVIAEITADTAENYTTGTVQSLSAVAEIGKSVETSSESKYYDNKAQIVINAEGSDEITITCAPLTLENLALITGKTYDSTKGAFIDGERETRYFALGYRTKGTDGRFRYVWRYKGTFNIPDETSATEDDGTDSNNTELTYTGIYTTHVFENGGSAKGMVVDSIESSAEISTFFSAVTTPDSLTAKQA